jgi:hypothetical protein
MDDLQAADPHQQLCHAMTNYWLRDAVQEIRELRNRIAHYEPIITRDLAIDLQRLRRIASFVGHDVEHWLVSVESVSTLLSSRPR